VWCTMLHAPIWPVGWPRGGSLATRVLQCSVVQCGHMKQCYQRGHCRISAFLLQAPICGPQDDGFIAQLLVGDGTKDIKVNTPLAVIVEEKVRPRC
jgi:hypothetical protein